MDNLNEFIQMCEESMITDANLGDIAIEGLNMNTAKLIRSEDIKKARELVKSAKKLKKEKNFRQAIKNLENAKTMVIKMKSTIDRTNEPDNMWSAFLSYLTPIFSTLPTEKLTGFMIIPTGRDSFYIRYTTEIYTDSMSKNTRSNVKTRLQEKLNLFIHNINISIKAYKELEKKHKIAASKVAKESAIGEDADYDVEIAMEEVLETALESKLSSEDREKLPDEMFGVPELRKFPLHDKEHIFLAIKYFKFCKGTYRKQLAESIVKRMNDLDIPVKFDDKSLISKYL